MDAAGRKLLAAAVGAADQDPAGRWRDPFHCCADSFDLCRDADDGRITLLADPRAKLGILAFKAACLKGALHHQQKPVLLERLFDEVIGAVANGLDSRLDSAMPRDHQHRHLGVDALDPLQQFKAVHIRISHPDIQNGKPRRLGGEEVSRFHGRRRFHGREPFVPKGCPDQESDVAFIIDDEDVTRRFHSPCLFIKQPLRRPAGPA